MERRPKRTAYAVLGILCCAWLQACASGPPPTATELGWSALDTGDWRSAKTHFAAALDADPADGRAWHGQARAQLEGRDPEAALLSLTRLGKVDPGGFRGIASGTYSDTLYAAVARRLDRHQSEAALAAARALVQIDAGRSGSDRLLGQALLAEATRKRLGGERDAAYALYSEACQVTPGTLDAWVGAAEILLEKREGRKAIRLLEAARKTHPTAGAIRTLTLQAMRVR